MLSLLACSALAATQNVCGDWKSIGSGHDTVCVKEFTDTRMSWFEAEASCRLKGGNLATVTTSEMASILRDASPNAWIGGAHDEEWTWSTGMPLNTSDLLGLVGMRMFPEQTCLTARSSDSCNMPHSYVCQWRSCPFNARTIHSKSLNTDIRVTYAGTIFLGGVPMGLGVWEKELRYTVRSWEVRKTFGCLDSDSWVLSLVPAGAGFEAYAGCSSSPLTKITFTGSMTCLGGMAERNSAGPSPPSATDTPSPTDTPLGQPESTSSSSSIPIWAWPLAFASVAVASALIAVGALSRKHKLQQAAMQSRFPPKDGPRVEIIVPDEMEEVEGSVATPESAGAETQDGPPNPSKCPRHKRTTDTCDTCKKFNAAVARRRLKAVHEQLARDFSLPLVIHDSRCEHIGADHVHIFSVENDFDPSTLGALSTVYSRAKPRLPRSTRIHIEQAGGEYDPFEGNFQDCI
eukprot:TRINITY_DN5753_c0_g1_i1.p1 TRINITY_DN5753_c0_g1~~TRINITY_DN5753_c0_g1_i1.p1  ORF type:complete len:460 (+),score=68.02 TRINITY_DN5753_c0_g1_i1:53-1432(+)